MLTKTKQDNMKPLKQMNFDPMTGAPIIQPGPQNANTARSSEMYEVANAGYPQGSMVNAINANPMMANIPSQGLMQKEEFDASKADRDKDGKVSDWEKASVKSFTK